MDECARSSRARFRPREFLPFCSDRSGGHPSVRLLVRLFVCLFRQSAGRLAAYFNFRPTTSWPRRESLLPPASVHNNNAGPKCSYKVTFRQRQASGEEPLAAFRRPTNEISSRAEPSRAEPSSAAQPE